MSVVNSHSLTVDNLNDPTSLEPLTSNHLLTMKSVTALPPPGRFLRIYMLAKDACSVSCRAILEPLVERVSCQHCYWAALAHSQQKPASQ